jgi:CubicO group peptidase (beta-lactamase class C family)
MNIGTTMNANMTRITGKEFSSHTYRIISIITILFLLTGCAGPDQKNSSATPWPTKDWISSTPAEQDMDPAILDQMLAHIDETHLNLHSLLVIRHGAIVLEKYYPGHDRGEKHVQYSVTKSFTSTLYGIAVDQGKLKGVDFQVKDFFPLEPYENPDPRKESMTMEDMLTMSTGLDWVEGDPAYSRLYMSGDWVKFMMSLPQTAQPGETFNYCSGCSHVILRVVEKAVGKDVVDFAKASLFQPLGIRDTTWERNPEGEAIGGWGLNLTARDMAKLGYLYLHGGEWNGKQVVSRAWVEKATTKHIDTDGRLGYGYQWWIYPTHNAFAALGRDGQTIFVIPDLDIIVVTTAQIAGHDPVFTLIDNYIIPAASEKPGD